jgi:hypothetical protein
MTTYDVVKKLIGPITPVGQTDQDIVRYNNLYQMCHLVEDILAAISEVSGYTTSSEYSVNRAGNFAKDFIKEIKKSL